MTGEPIPAKAPGRRSILLVEDNFMVALALEAVLHEGSYEIVGPYGTLADAVQAAEVQRLDAAILDFDLGGQAVTPVIAVLARRRVPFVILSGHAVMGETDLTSAAQILRKPVSRAQLKQSLDEIFSGKRNGTKV